MSHSNDGDIYNNEPGGSGPTMLDIPTQQGLEIRIAPDGRVWVNTDKGCVLRVGRGDPDTIEVCDERVPSKRNSKTLEALQLAYDRLAFDIASEDWPNEDDSRWPVLQTICEALKLATALHCSLDSDHEEDY